MNFMNIYYVDINIDIIDIDEYFIKLSFSIFFVKCYKK